jgi:hypothetical protein
MARVTLTFEVEVDLDIPDELAPRMTAQDVCDCADIAARNRGNTPIILSNEVLSARCSWVMRPRHSELPFEEGVVGIIPADTFALIAEPVGAQ